MSLDEQFAATIIKVEASFGFCQFRCAPEVISIALEIEPDEVLREGQLSAGQRIASAFNSWSIQSRSSSKDVNDHLRDLFSQLVRNRKPN